MNIKKILALVLCCTIILLSLAGCGETTEIIDNSSSQQDVVSSSSEVVEEVSSSSEVAEEVSSSSEVVEEVSSSSVAEKPSYVTSAYAGLIEYNLTPENVQQARNLVKQWYNEMEPKMSGMNSPLDHPDYVQFMAENGIDNWPVFWYTKNTGRGNNDISVTFKNPNDFWGLTFHRCFLEKYNSFIIFSAICEY